MTRRTIAGLVLLGLADFQVLARLSATPVPAAYAAIALVKSFATFSLFAALMRQPRDAWCCTLFCTVLCVALHADPPVDPADWLLLTGMIVAARAALLVRLPVSRLRAATRPPPP
jgi:hypothetical protein